MKALVTGASSGIGRQYATVLARDYHSDLLLVSNQDEALKEVCAELSAAYGVCCEHLSIDLSEGDAAERVYQWALSLGEDPVDVLINDAGVFFFESFAEASPGKIETMLMLHVVTLSKLCRLFGADMCSRGRGWILNMSSLCAWMAFPYIQTYCASKDFILNFSRSIRFEFRQKGVNVLAVTPGAVDTSLYHLSDSKRALAVRLHVSIPPEKLAQKALKALFKGKKSCMPGLINHLALPLCRHLPDWAVRLAMRRVNPRKIHN